MHNKPFKQNRLYISMFKQPVWWSLFLGWLSFIPLSPLFTVCPLRCFVECRISKQLMSSAHCILEKNKWRGGTRRFRTTFQIGYTKRTSSQMQPKLYGCNTKFQAILHPCPCYFIMTNHINLSLQQRG